MERGRISVTASKTNACNELFGRWLTGRNGFTPIQANELKIIAQPALEVSAGKIRCRRCGQKTGKKRALLPHGQYYCPRCLNFGRLTSLDTLYTISEPNFFEPPKQILTWEGQLSPYQQKTAKRLLQTIDQQETFLLWAVTGAGKTEILFPALARAFAQGKRVCLASPRIDVCNELYPRLMSAFSQISLVLLHGQQQQKYRYTQLVICTTHQLIRFVAAFDVLIVDEVDAFPFRNNAWLSYAVQTARKKNSTLLLLTATPTKQLLRQVHKGRLAFGYLPLRYHGYLLPQPQVFCEMAWKKKIAKGEVPARLKRILLTWIKQQKPFLVFVPRITLLAPVYRAICRVLPSKIQGTTVHASDVQRSAKVAKMRLGEYHFLVTTTILERGVTFPRLNVVVLGADDEIFMQSVLVQIAGRVGRSRACPTGDVYFICTMQNTEIKAACKQIAFVNRKGRRMKNEMLSALPKKKI